LRQPGHRFFFGPAEVEPLPLEEQVWKPATSAPRILIAGIGNIFLGDDGFGVEVVRRLAVAHLPESVRVVDFGIRGLDLAYALQDGYETTILIDAFPNNQPPGTISVVEPDTSAPAEAPGGFVEPHSMHPLNVLRMATAMNGSVGRVLLVGCEPATLGGEEGHMGLSAPVEVAVDEAVRTAQALVRKILDGEPTGD
jgi:hydrogenase maturation protease